MLSTLKGLPIVYELVCANTDERQAVVAVLEAVRHCDIYGDKGFVGQNWQEEIKFGRYIERINNINILLI